MESYPLVDSRIIAQVFAMRREVQHPSLLHDEPVMPNAQAYGSVLRDRDGKWRMWYLGAPVYSGYYAHSVDGLNWQRPTLDLVAAEVRGELNGPNAFLCAKQKDINGKWLVEEKGPEGFCVLDAEQTPHPAARGRFTALYLARRKTESGMYIAHSDDGIHWRADQDHAVIPGWRDTSSVLLYDARLKKYVWYGRPTATAAPRMHANRVIARKESEDLIHWTPDHTVMDTDDADADPYDLVDEAALRAGKDAISAAERAKAWSELTENARVSDKQPLVRGRNRQWYGITPFPYGNLYLGIAWMYDIPSGDIWTELVHSYDGIDWRREAMRLPFIPRVRGVCACTMASPPIVVGDDIWIYDSVQDKNHHGVRNLLVKQGVRAMSLRRDRWVGYSAGHCPGEILTQPFEKPESIHLNAMTAHNGWLKVEATDAEGCTAEGFSQADCEPISGNGLTLIPRWRSGKTLGHIKESVVRLRLHAKHASIFAFYVERARHG